ncbi:uncharacterized protein PAC_17098 [Phialocephala subalpina]|uniref:DUF6536 domain-containing protein n=1 Tax=Phialocephala subalpina TaxID=576137 RepID=A0A1L7XQ99_9HELO|nr:uncharacterized protein PAC_17098 [Phialocephala subalpina]
MMAENRSSDQLHLLEHAASIQKNPPTEGRDSRGMYEMVDLDSSDIGIQKSPVASQYPPAYSSRWEEDLENVGKKDTKSFNGYSRSLQDRSPTFDNTIKPAPNGWHSFLGFIRRSGRYVSHVQYEYAAPRDSEEPRKFSGWRGGILAAACSSGLVLLINLIFTIWAAAKSKSGTQVGTIYAGDCATVRKADSGLHIAINVMGTMLLGASNYTMQCLSSPTRKEVDAAHSRGKYLDIGLPSPKNLNGWKKKIVFTFLVLSTVPLHFLWNSAVFTTTQQLDYNAYIVTPNFLTNGTVDCSQNATVLYGSYNTATWYDDRWPLYFTSLPGYGNYTNAATSNDYWYQTDVCNISKALRANYTQGGLTRLDNEACIKTYGQGDDKLQGYGNVLVVTKEQPASTNNTILMQLRFEEFISNYTGNNWVCDPAYLIANNYNCKYKTIAADADQWTLGSYHSDPSNEFALKAGDQWDIDYCLAQPSNLAGVCQLQYSLVIMIIVLIANSIKFSCILFLLLTHLEPILATIGDGIASFLNKPDRITAFRPFLDRSHARNFRRLPPKKPVRYFPPKRARIWWHAPSPCRWFLTLSLCTLAIIIVSVLLGTGNDNVMSNGDYSSPYGIGFGTYNSDATLNIFPTSNAQTLTAKDFSSNSILIGMVAVANLPQVIVSCLYFAYNTVYTSMVSADEWSRFTLHRKALRTTDPKGEQRSTYWLSLPWTYALPLAIASSVLHWLISQSLFVSRTEILDTYGNPEPISYMEVGYSPLAILISLLFGSGMVIAMIANGTRKLKGGVLVGNNSLAISAACHRSTGDTGAELRKVRWGALHHQMEDGTPGHCCFTSEEVEPPRVGDLYI